MKCIITWDEKIFDGITTILPDRTILYTQIYVNDKETWSIVFQFNHSPKEQGIITIADEVYFLSSKAPKELLKVGFTFDFRDGKRVIGRCELIE